MPTDLAVAAARKREALEFARSIETLLLSNFIACLIVLILMSISPAVASVVELLILE